MDKKLYRSNDDKMLAGVAAGLADYFEIDPILVRIIFLALVFANGLGVIGYIIFWILMPEAPAGIPQGEKAMENNQAAPSTPSTPTGEERRRRMAVLPGVVLIVLGIIFLISNFVPQYDMGKLWPVLLVVVGVALLWPRKR